MIIIAILSLVIGVLCGQLFFGPELISAFSHLSDYILYILIFAVGISLGTNKQAFYKIKEYHVKILIIPAAVILGSLVGGILAGLLVGLPLRESLTVASGLGWYSLSGVFVTKLAGAKLGTLAFLSCLAREIFSFMIIPFIPKILNKYAAIAPAGATSMDTTLPVIIKCAGAEIAIMAVINGVICTAAVPILINFFYGLF